MKALISVVGTIVLALFFIILILGIIMPSPVNVPSDNFYSDNWFHVARPNWAIVCFIALALILTPAKYIFFWRKKTKD